MDRDPNRKIWVVNKSPHATHKIVPSNDNGEPRIAPNTMQFDLDRIAELYRNTRTNCGARHVWADAMALCGTGLDNNTSLISGGRHKHKWPRDLIWNVMRIALRSTRVRRTMAIEQRHPKEWCKRFHEHGKHNDAPCYRDLAKLETDKAEFEVRRLGKTREVDGSQNGVEIDSEVDGIGGVQKRVSFVDSIDLDAEAH